MFFHLNYEKPRTVLNDKNLGEPWQVNVLEAY